LPALRQGAGCEIRACAGQATMAVRRCQYQFTRRDGYGTPDEVKQAAVTLYGYGLSLNAVGLLELWRKLGDDEVRKVAYRGRCLKPA
jgi:hypothetical protein